jgi:hypothetical protein
MVDRKPNIVFFFWDNFGWGELGCYGGGVLRGAPTPRIDALAGQGLRLLNFNVEAQCTPSRSALLTGRHAIRSGTQAIPLAGGPDGMTRWEVTIARALSDAGYATGMWGKWHLGSDPDQRSPVDFGFDEAVWSPRTADEVFWTMQSYFPRGEVTARPYAGDKKVPLEYQTIYSRKKGARAEPVGAVGQEDPAHDVELPQLHRFAAFPPDIRRRRAAALAGGDQPVTGQHPVERCLRGDRDDVAAGELERQPGRAPPRVRPPQLAHRRLDPGGDLMRAGPRPVRPVGQGGQTARPVTAHPGVHALPRHPMAGGYFGDRAPGLGFQHSAIPLFHDTQLHQHRPGLPRDRQ